MRPPAMSAIEMLKGLGRVVRSRTGAVPVPRLLVRYRTVGEVGEMRDIRHRIGALEVATAASQVEVASLREDRTDHEQRIRKLEFLTAKVIGGAILGSSIGGLLLSKLIDYL